MAAVLVAVCALAFHWHAADDDGIAGAIAVSDVPAARPRGPSFADRFEMVTSGDRVQPAIAQPPGQPPQPVMGGQVAWFDPGYSFGGDRRGFTKPARPVQQVAKAPQPASQPVPAQPAPKPVEAAALPPPPREVATVPVPQAKTAEVRNVRTRTASTHDMLVRKARSVLLAQAKSGKPAWLDRLFGNEPQTAPAMAYASADGADVTGSIDAAAGDDNPVDRFTAVYDIVAATVYMPDGSKLEAHSGLGAKMDKPAYAHVKMHGVTPPHVYDITPREALFHGVAALRLTPLGGAGAIHNRTGLLAHNYLLGPNGDSNGCVSFKDYGRFLRAYHSGQVKRLVVVGSMD